MHFEDFLILTIRILNHNYSKMKRLMTILFAAAAMGLAACSDNADDVIPNDLQIINADVQDQVLYTEADFPDKRLPRPTSD
jgi:hypothetical protein